MLASGNGSNFEALVNSKHLIDLNINIQILIVNTESCEAITRAARHGIECIVLDHRLFEKREDHEREIFRILDHRKIEGIVLAGWMRIITPFLISKYKNRIVNIHPSLLPSFKGANAIKQAYTS